MGKYNEFKTDDVEGEEKRIGLNEAVNNTLTRLKVLPLENVEIKGTVSWVNLPNTTLASFDLGPMIFDRSPDFLEDGDDRYSLIACVGGNYEIIVPTGDVIPVAKGMAGLVSHQMPSRTVAKVNNQEKTLVFPRDSIAHAIRDPENRIGPVPEGGMPAVRLMASYMAGLLNEKEAIPERLQTTIEGHVLDLVAHAYDPAGEWSRAEPNGGVKAARIGQLMDHIAENYADKTLSAETLGQAFSLSPRIVQSLLSETGNTLTEHLLEYRLQAARRVLQSDLTAGLQISQIAYDAGFNDLSYFNRAFKRRFGDTPSGLRNK